MQVRRTLPRLSASAFVLALFALGPAHAQQIVLTNTRGLDFGRFVAGTGGTIVLSPTGVRSRTGGVVLLNSPTVGQASFNVGKSSNGVSSKAVVISLPSSTRLTSGLASMTVNNFVSAPAAIQTVPNGGTTLAVGATLNVAQNQPPGAYSGTFSLTVNFQ